VARIPPVCAALALLAAHAAGAQAPAEPETPADEMVIRGVRTGELPGEPTAFGELLRTGDFVAERKDLADLLSEQAGVFVRRFGGAGDRAEVSIRGSTSEQVAVSIDGIRANSALTGGFDLSRVCIPLVEEIAIARGAGATREGSGAVGGAIDLVTRSGSAEPVNRVSGSGGAYDTWEGSAFRAASAGLGDRSLDYSLGYCGLHTKGDFEFARASYEDPDGNTSEFDPDRSTRINNERTQHGATLGLGSRIGPGTLRLAEYFAYSDGGEPGVDCCNGDDAGQNPEADSTDWSNLAQLRYESDPLTRAHDGLQLALYHRYEDSEYEDPLRAPFGDPVHTRAGISTPGARATSAWRLDLGPVAQRFEVGLDGWSDHLDADMQPSRSRATGAVRLSDEVSFWDARALLVPALRAEKTEGFDFEWIPALGALVEPWDWLRLRANATRAYRTPDFDELYHPDQGFLRGNPDLEPEDAWSFDTGFELLLAQLGPVADTHFTASVFRREIDDSIVWVQINQTTIAPINTGEATLQGVELALSFRVTDWARVTLNHTELDSERDSTGEELPGVPKRESFARLQLGPPDLVKLVGEWQRTDELLVDEGTGSYLPDRSVWNASFSLNLAALRWLRLERWSHALWVYVEGNNLSDEAVRDALTFPQPGRSFAGGFEASW
jgi:outer membrane cobalamin receptor